MINKQFKIIHDTFFFRVSQITTYFIIMGIVIIYILCRTVTRSAIPQLKLTTTIKYSDYEQKNESYETEEMALSCHA